MLRNGQQRRRRPDNSSNGYTRRSRGLLASDTFYRSGSLADKWNPSANFALAGDGTLAGNMPGGGAASAHARLPLLGFAALTNACLQLDSLHKKTNSFPGWLSVGVRSTDGARPNTHVGFDPDIGGVGGQYRQNVVLGDLEANTATRLASQQQNELTWHSQKLEIISGGRVRAWLNQPDNNATLNVLADSSALATPATFEPSIWMKNDDNKQTGNASARRFLLMKSNTVTFTGIANASVIVNVNGGADNVLALSAAGLNAWDAGGVKFPASIRMRFRNGAAAVVADLTIPDVYGGDVIGLFNYTPLDPNNFSVSLQSSGLLFADDFARADGAPGGNWNALSGTWSIVSGKLKCTASGVIKCLGFAPQRDLYTQALITRDDLNTTNWLVERLSADNLSGYYMRIYNAGEVGNADHDTLWLQQNGGGFSNRGGNGGAAIGEVAGVAQRFNFAMIGDAKAIWVNGAAPFSTTEAFVTGIGQIAFNFGLNSGAAYVDDVKVCSGRVVKVANMPDNWKLRITGVGDSAPAASGEASLDIGGKLMPLGDIRIVDNVGVERKVLNTNVHGGDIYTLTTP